MACYAVFPRKSTEGEAIDVERDWNHEKMTIQIRQIVQMEDACGITFSTEMLAHLKVEVGEEVHVVVNNPRLKS